MTKEYIISDNDENIIQRDEILKKIAKLTHYLSKIERRETQLDQELEKIHLKGADKKLTEKAKKLYHLDQNISKEI